MTNGATSSSIKASARGSAIGRLASAGGSTTRGLKILVIKAKGATTGVVLLARLLQSVLSSASRSSRVILS